MSKIKHTNISNDIQKTYRQQANEAEKIFNSLLDENTNEDKSYYFIPVILSKICSAIHYNELLQDLREVDRLEILFKDVLDNYITSYLKKFPLMDFNSILKKLIEEYKEKNLHWVEETIYELYKSNIIQFQED
jgi:sulfatase maturation enzyme AslB (radical SAM superfamily)